MPWWGWWQFALPVPQQPEGLLRPFVSQGCCCTGTCLRRQQSVSLEYARLRYAYVWKMVV